jgi:hypothetical protein
MHPATPVLDRPDLARAARDLDAVLADPDQVLYPRVAEALVAALESGSDGCSNLNALRLAWKSALLRYALRGKPLTKNENREKSPRPTGARSRAES